MVKKFRKSLFIFRRDLRLEDNTALIESLSDSDQVLACFIIDPRQVSDRNKYRGEKTLQFMLESLHDLDQSLKSRGAHLYYFYGKAEQIVGGLINSIKLEAVYLNKDYTIFSRKRDAEIEKVCMKNSVEYNAYDDICLAAPGSVLKDDGKPYTVYTPFYKKALRSIEIPEPRKNNFKNYYHAVVKTSFKNPADKIKIIACSSLYINGGRNKGLALLKKVKNLDNYKQEREIPALDATSSLSAHHKFGTISVRETYHTALKAHGKNSTFISELYWRDFFTQVSYYHPHIYNGSFRKQYDDINWENDKKLFDAWCQGKTGYPIVDAGMRELSTTGFMHNRVRMIVASFLTKDLLISWRWGERWFAKHLIDYDPAVNNGNWQWAASTGCDAQPYFRIFNPWLQQKKFDPECLYIKKWIPELKDLDAKEIHKLEKEDAEIPQGYFAPIVDHYERRDTALEMYKEVRD
ncbi:MAG: deoxyribodipyrimidine photo-lyase [Bdellovibrionota bacterium]